MISLWGKGSTLIMESDRGINVVLTYCICFECISEKLKLLKGYV